jgi:hypothetical protein
MNVHNCIKITIISQCTGSCPYWCMCFIQFFFDVLTVVNVFSVGNWRILHSSFPIRTSECTFTKLCAHDGSNCNSMRHMLQLAMHRLSKILGASWNSKCQKGDIKQVPHWGSTNKMCHHSKLIFHGGLACGILFTPYGYNYLIGHVQPWLIHLILMCNET